MSSPKKPVRVVYRKWSDPSAEFTENYLTIAPSGKMLEISFGRDNVFKSKVRISLTSMLSPLDPKVFKKHKEICTRKEWDMAIKRVIELVKLRIE